MSCKKHGPNGQTRDFRAHPCGRKPNLGLFDSQWPASEIFVRAVGGENFTLDSADVAAALGNLPANGLTIEGQWSAPKQGGL